MKLRPGGMRKGELIPIIIHEYGGQKWIDPYWYGDSNGKVSISPKSEGAGDKDTGSPSSGIQYGVPRTNTR